MKSFTIYKHASGRTEVVKQGWSWPAFFFVGIWALTKRLWVVAAITIPLFLIVYAVVIGSSQTYEAGGLSMVDRLSGVWILAKVFVGAMGNQWRVKRLVSEGFEPADTVSAANAQQALALQPTQG